MVTKKKAGRATYVLAILAASLGIDWGYSHILDAHRKRGPKARLSRPDALK